MTFSDIEKLGKMSSLLTIPLIAASLYVEFGFWFTNTDGLYQFVVDLGFPWLTQIFNLISFFFSVFVTSFAYIIINSMLSQSKPLLFFIALTLISYGLLGVLSVVGSDKLTVLFASNTLVNQNYIMHIAALSWGFDIFYTQEKVLNG